MHGEMTIFAVHSMVRSTVLWFYYLFHSHCDTSILHISYRSVAKWGCEERDSDTHRQHPCVHQCRYSAKLYPYR
jgi:hypothetical protein